MQVERGAGLHIDERQVVGDHVVELPGDPQLLLARAQPLLPPRGRGAASTARSRRMRTISVVVASTSSHAARPSAAADARVGSPVPTTAGSHRNGTHPSGDRRPRDESVAGEEHGAERDDQREVDGALRVSRSRRTPAWSRRRPRAPPTGAPPAGDEAQRRRRRAGHRERIEVAPGVLVGAGEAATRLRPRRRPPRSRHRCGRAPGPRGRASRSARVIPATVGGAARGASSRTA